jgi:tetratricopeptide (TPR) repeat protein
VDAPIRAATAWRHLRPLLYNSRKKAPPFAGPTFIVSPRFALLLPLLICTLIGAQTSTADARALFEERRYPEAEAAFAARIAIRPDDAEAHFYLGRLALARQQIAESLPHLERAVELAPNQAEYQFQLGAASMQQAGRLGLSFKALGRVKKGRIALEQAVALEPRNVSYRQAILEFYAQAPGIAGGGIDKAYAQAEALRPLDARAATLAFAGLQAREKNYVEAISLVEALLQGSPNDFQALYFIGRTAAEHGVALDRGIAALQTCLTLTPPPRSVGHASVNYRLGQALTKSGSASAARAAFEAVLKIDPNHAGARTELDRMPTER